MDQSSFICTQLNDFKYCYLILAIQFNISHLFAHRYMVKQLYLPSVICLHTVKGMYKYCDTMKGVRQADDLFVCFDAKPNKGLSLRSRRDRQWARERQRRSWKKELREGSWRRETQRGSRQRTAEETMAVRKTDKMSSQSAVDNGQQKEAVREAQSG